MLYYREGDDFGISLFTGPNYVTLWLTLLDAERDPAPDIVQVRDRWCPDIDFDVASAAVLAGVDRANARFGGRWNPMAVRFAMERPSEHLLGEAAYQIVERLATVGEAAYVPTEVETFRGTVVALRHGAVVRVRLADGREVDAVIPKRLIRNLFILQLGDEADVMPKPPPKMARVRRVHRGGRWIA
jgi:translation initiation factor IF-1